MTPSRAISPASRNVSADTQGGELFKRFALRYGSLWVDRWIGVPLEQAKQEWDHALCKYHPVQIRQAIEWCGKFPPSLNEFVTLCESAPRPFVKAVSPTLIKHRQPERVPMPPHVRDQINKFLKQKQPT